MDKDQQYLFNKLAAHVAILTHVLCQSTPKEELTNKLQNVFNDIYPSLDDEEHTFFMEAMDDILTANETTERMP